MQSGVKKSKPWAGVGQRGQQENKPESEEGSCGERHELVREGLGGIREMGVRAIGSLRALLAGMCEVSGLEQMCLNINTTLRVMSLWWAWTEAP